MYLLHPKAVSSNQSFKSRYDERHRDQDEDMPILSNDDEMDDAAPRNDALTLEQQKAELKRRIMQPAPKR